MAGKKVHIFADTHDPFCGHLDGSLVEGENVEKYFNEKNQQNPNEQYNVIIKKHGVPLNKFKKNGRNNYIVHITGHGSNASGVCHFIFSDGEFYPDEIDELTSVPSKLFYASVCLCGSNESMANAFINKGTESFVGFKTTISDTDAAEFTKLVYQKWLDEGKTLATALDEADEEFPNLDSWMLWGNSNV
jgi:hypothetical protein